MFKLMLQFVQVAKAQNVTQAANVLCLSQPTLSHNMHKLEDKLETKLFNRTSKGIKLTQSGELLYEQAKMMQHLYENTLIKLKKNKLRHHTELKIGCGDAWWNLFIRDCVEEFRDNYPHSNIAIDIGDHLHLMSLLLSGDINIFVGHEILGLAKYEDVLFHPLFIHVDEVFVRKGHPLLGQLCNNKDLARFPSIALRTPNQRFIHLQNQTPELRSFDKLHYLQEKVTYQTNSLLTALDLLQNSDAIFPYPTGLKSYFESYDVVALKMSDYFNKSAVGVYLHKDKNKDEQTIALLAQFKQIIVDRPNLRF